MPDEAELGEWARVLAFTVLPVFEGQAHFPTPSRRPDWILLRQNTFLPRSGLPRSTTVTTVSPLGFPIFQVFGRQG